MDSVASFEMAAATASGIMTAVHKHYTVGRNCWAEFAKTADKENSEQRFCISLVRLKLSSKKLKKIMALSEESLYLSVLISLTVTQSTLLSSYEGVLGPD